jgi:hypothetical protein
MRFISILLIAGATGCVAAEGDESFVIVGSLVPDQESDSTIPVFNPSREGPFFSRGLGCVNHLEFFVGSLFESRVQAAEGRESLRTIQIQGANIELEVGPVSIVQADGTVTTTGAAETEQFQIAFSSSLPPNAGLSVGIYDLVPFEIMAKIRAKAGGALNDPSQLVVVEVLSTTTAFGDFYGDRIDSTSFVFPVLLTNDATETGPCFVEPEPEPI